MAGYNWRPNGIEAADQDYGVLIEKRASASPVTNTQ
jgi:hypothetical protein